MTTSFTLISVIGLGLYLFIMIFKWWIEKSDNKQKRKDIEKQEIKDIIRSGDNSRIHGLIDRLRRNKK